ncbi:unnamed protein product [Toxocara canis]|uniref:GED domain-containing protein n=1 Tax=Toxocara canis TaxID=6265 RepID=A0A183V8I7_TOXCA|nr:unnamed protein product [Toxocara canis]
MPSCLNRHGTLRERIEEVVALSITQVADLSDIELRSLIAYMLKLHRQQEQIYQGKRAKIEALREMLRQIEEDVAQLNKFLLFHTRSSCAPPAALHNFRGERPMVASASPSRSRRMEVDEEQSSVSKFIYFWYLCSSTFRIYYRILGCLNAKNLSLLKEELFIRVRRKGAYYLTAFPTHRPSSRGRGIRTEDDGGCKLQPSFDPNW